MLSDNIREPSNNIIISHRLLPTKQRNTLKKIIMKYVIYTEKNLHGTLYLVLLLLKDNMGVFVKSCFLLAHEFTGES